jgi:hypothetical protein
MTNDPLLDTFQALPRRAQRYALRWLVNADDFPLPDARENEAMRQHLASFRAAVTAASDASKKTRRGIVRPGSIRCRYCQVATE